MPSYRRGAAAIEEAAQSKGGGGFRAFAPTIRWQDDGEKKYILVLTPIDEVGTFDLHEWIPVGKGEKANGETFTRYEDFLSRKDPFIEEDFDDITDRLGRTPKTRCAGVAVELEPVMETVKGRQRPKGFVVKTGTFQRKNEDGTEQEITYPVIGLIVQSSALMWSPLTSLDNEQGPITELPVAITRRGKDQNTRYDFVPFSDAPVDLSPVVEYLDGISYLTNDVDEVVAAIEATEDELAAAQVVAEALFNKRLEELADKDRYEELISPLEELPAAFGAKGGAKKGNARPSRPARPSQRQAAAPAEESTDEGGQEEAPAAESKNDRFAALKARVEASKS
jgi:hypothetical protein